MLASPVPAVARTLSVPVDETGHQDSRSAVAVGTDPRSYNITERR